MKKVFKKLAFWGYLKFHSIMTAISIALFNTENEILKADPNNLGESNKHVQRMRSRNQVLEKFYAGQTDEKYVKDYYEVLKKADNFIKTATPHQMAVAAYKYGTSYGMKDQYGRRYEHYGFFDDKHKHAGKTLAEVMALEFEERRTNDDEYKLDFIFNNIPIEVGFVKALDYLQKSNNKNNEIIFSGDTNQHEIIISGDSKTHINENDRYNEFEVKDIVKLSKQFEFPIKIYREDDGILNKIEQLTEFLHVKHVNSQTKQFEFFIPNKFKTSEVEDNSKIFNELINIKTILIDDDYGELISYNVDGYIKRIKYKDTHEVWKFRGNEMEVVGKKI